MSNLKNELHHIPCLPGCGDFGRISTCPVCLLKAEWRDLQELAAHHRKLWMGLSDTCSALTIERDELRTAYDDLNRRMLLINEIITHG